MKVDSVRRLEGGMNAVYSLYVLLLAWCDGAAFTTIAALQTSFN